MRHTRSLSLPRDRVSPPPRSVSGPDWSADHTQQRDGIDLKQAEIRSVSALEDTAPRLPPTESGQAQLSPTELSFVQQEARESIQLPPNVPTPISAPLPTTALLSEELPRKRLRGIIDTIEGVLLARVRLRQSQDHLKNSRKYLVRSMEAVESRMASQIQTSTAQTESNSTNVNAGQTRSLSNRFRRLRSPSPATAGRSSSNADSAFAILGDTTSTAASSENMQTLSSLLDQYRLDIDRVRKDERLFEAELDALSNQEYRLEEMLQTLMHDFRDHEAASRMLRKLSEATEGSTQTGGDDASEDDLPPIVEAYFSKTGDVGVFKERLQVLDYNHAEGQLARNLIKDRGDTLEVSDEDFLHNYESHRTKIQADIQAASAEAADLLERCKVQGYDTELYRTARKSDTGGTLSPVPSLSALTPYVPVQVPPSELGPLSTSASIMAGRSQRIDSWLRAVDADAADLDFEPGPLTLDEGLMTKDDRSV